MKEFTYTVKDAYGLHARPASQLVQLSQTMKSNVTVSVKGNDANAKQVIALMRLCIKCGDTLSFKIDGEDEGEGAERLKAFCAENL